MIYRRNKILGCKKHSVQNDFVGFAIYSKENRPIGVVSQNEERSAFVPLGYFPKKIKDFLIEIEDKRFYQHGAVDFRSIIRAVFLNAKAGRIVQGGSTITQQLARNIQRACKRNIFRKIRETKLAFDLEYNYSKNEILDLYFNNVFWGKKNYGLRPASLEYFGKEPCDLNIKEQITLLTLLRGPNFYINSQHHLESRYFLLCDILYKRDILSKKTATALLKAKISIKKGSLEVVRNGTIQYIKEKVDYNKLVITSTLKLDLQQKVRNFILRSRFPTSVVAFSKEKVVCFGSSHGSEYPFSFRTNVGSTFKPFIYYYLRKNGITSEETFSTRFLNSDFWNIREAQKSDEDSLTLKDALVRSNNNAFVNGAYFIGVDRVLEYLSKITDLPVDYFVPSSILGATTKGLTLYELGKTYSDFFYSEPQDDLKEECKAVLREIAVIKFDGELDDTFLKTGTTNNSKERFAVVGTPNTLFAFLREGQDFEDYTKDEGFLENILSFLKEISQTDYKW